MRKNTRPETIVLALRGTQCGEIMAEYCNNLLLNFLYKDVPSNFVELRDSGEQNSCQFLKALLENTGKKVALVLCFLVIISK